MIKIKTEEYVKLVDFAWEVAKKSPEQIQSDVFQITYSSLLKQNLSTNTQNLDLTSSTPSILNESTTPISTFDQKMKVFAEKCNLSISDLKDVFYIDDMAIHMLVTLKGADAEKQATSSQCILTAYQILFDEEWLGASQLKKCVKDSNIDGMDHFARNLRRRKNILVRGKGKGATLEYKISGSGRIEAFEIIHDFVKGEL